MYVPPEIETPKREKRGAKSGEWGAAYGRSNPSPSDWEIWGSILIAPPAGFGTEPGRKRILAYFEGQRMPYSGF